MMKLVKKIISALLVVVMICTVNPSVRLNLSVGAVSYSANDAINALYSVKGTSIDYDGCYGAQCVDLILWYYNKLGVSTSSGNAYQYSTNTLPSGWTRTAGGTPQKGDILVYAGGSGNGHVAIYESDYVTWHQNWSGKYVQRLENRYYGSLKASDGAPYWGCIHPNFSDTTTKPTVNIDKTLNTLSTDTTFSFSNVSSASSVHLYIYQGTTLYFEGQFGVSDTYTRKFYATGHYSCYVIAHYSGYDVESDWRGFDIVESFDDYVPQKPTLYANVKYGNPNEEITFYHWSEKASKYTFSIYKDNVKLSEENIYTGSHTVTFSEIGKYSIYATADNSYGSSEIAEITFCIGTYKVKYYTAKNSTVFLNQTKIYGTDLKLTDSVPQKENYNFVEWNTSADGTGKAYHPGDTYSKNSDLTLYAIWQINHSHSYKVVEQVDAKCTTNGYIKYKCSICNKTYTQTLNATGHTDGEWKVTKPATYTETGIRTLYCKDCGAVLRTEIIPVITGKVHSVSINNIEVNYKNTATVKPEIKTEGNVEYTVKYETSNSKIATVDDNGNITTYGKGTAEITCTVTDEYGNKVEDTCTVTVKFSFGQWIIWILLLGFLWY